jgi:ABC-type Fe3+-hydroxamate transport system substrate-binding protein
MHISRRAGCLALCTSALLLVGCTSTPEEPPAASATSAPGTYGVPLDPTKPEPTFVATDAPPTTQATNEATVRITYFGWNPDAGAVELGGFVASVVEADGTCTMTLTKGQDSRSTSRPATPNVNNTACGEQLLPGDQLSSGTWSAVLSYDSPTSHGVSEPVEVQVP